MIYISDKSKKGQTHLLPGEGILQLPNLIRKIKKADYQRPFSVKLNLTKEELADGDKVELLLTKAREYIVRYFDEA